MLRTYSSILTIAVLLSPTCFAQQSQPSGQSSRPVINAVSAEPNSTMATYGDWVLRCQKTEKMKVCEIVQSVNLQGQSAPIAQIALGSPNPKEKIKLTVVLPNNVSFPSTPRLDSGENKPGVSLTWRRCLPVGCFADSALDESILKQLRSSSDSFRLIFNEGSGRDVALPLSLTGLPQALDALARQ